MNIANIFGLHLGCKIKDIKTGEIGVLNSVIHHEEITGGFYLVYENETVPIKDCKLLLKPLSKITDEDKAEFFKEFDGLKHLEKDFSGINSIMGICELVIENKSHRFKVPLTGKVSLWLCSKGYNIGIVPDEYCEVEE